MEGFEGLPEGAICRLTEVVVAAAMEAVEAPYVVVSQREDGSICAIEGPYLDVVAAIRDVETMESCTHEPGLRFQIAALWPPPPGTDLPHPR